MKKHMTLAEYLEETGMSQASFSKKTGITAPTINSILKGRDPRISTGLLIEHATRGIVRCRDLVNLKTFNKKFAMARPKKIPKPKKITEHEQYNLL
jgi:predicted transcriptional regulator